MRRAGVVATSLGLLAGSFALVAAGAPAASAAELCSDNLVVSRVGDGSAALTSAGTAVFLDEYTRAGAPVQSFPLPTVASGDNRAFVNSGSATSNLSLARSSDGAFLTLAGYDAAAGTAGVTNSSSAAVARVVARVDCAGTIDTTTALGDAFSGDNFRSAVTDDGTRFWLGGSSSPTGSGGVRLAALGATTSTSVSSTKNNMRWVTIQDGQLYVTSGSSTATGLNQVGTDLPTSSGEVATRVIDTTNGGTNSSSPYGAVLLDRSPAVAGVDTAYIADDQGGGAGGVRKYSFDGATWTARDRIAGQLRGIAGVGDAASATLWVTTTNNLVQTLTDAAAFDAPITGSLATIVTGATNTAIRGIALAPATASNCAAAAPTITDEPDDTTIATGGTATLTVVASGTAPLAYQWYRGSTGDTGLPVDGATDPSFTTPPLTSTTSYWVRVTNSSDGDDSRTATVTVSADPNTQPTISSPPPLADADNDPTGPTTTVTVGDTETGAGSLVVTATSSNPAVLADGGISITGSGSTRTLSFDPVGVGYSTVTIRVTDGAGLFAESTLAYAASAAAAVPGTTRFHAGAADASTAIDVGAGHAFVANDEDQIIRL